VGVRVIKATSPPCSVFRTRLGWTDLEEGEVSGGLPRIHTRFLLSKLAMWEALQRITQRVDWVSTAVSGRAIRSSRSIYTGRYRVLPRFQRGASPARLDCPLMPV